MDLAQELANLNLPAAVRAAILAQSELVKSQATSIESLTMELAYLRRMRYGAKTEVMSSEQRDLFEEALDADMAALEAKLAAEQANNTPEVSDKKPRIRAGRQALPAHLPRTDMVHEPESCSCGQCGQGLLKVGEDISEQLHVQPAVFSVLRHIRPQYACRRCQTMTAAPIPAAIIHGGLPTAATLAWVMVSKYVDHLPLYRLRQIAERSEVPLAESTLASWVGTVGWWLQPLADRLR